MASAADSAIAALQASHDSLTARISTFDDDALTRTSGATEWTIAQVLSHLGSGAEIMLGTLQTALSEPPPAQPDNEAIWDRWNAMTPRAQTDGYLATNEQLLDLFAVIDDSTRDSLRVDVGFLPEPVALEVVSDMRLNEVALHGWDVAVADDADATVERAAVPVLIGAFTGPLSFMLGFIGGDATTPAVLAVHAREPDQQLTLQLGEGVQLQPMAPASPDGELNIPAEALLRLLTGRLRPEHTPLGTSATGSLDLDALRGAFPGY